MSIDDMPTDPMGDTWDQHLRMNHIQVRGAISSYHDLPVEAPPTPPGARRLVFDRPPTAPGTGPAAPGTGPAATGAASGRAGFTGRAPGRAPRPHATALWDIFNRCLRSIAARVGDDRDHLTLVLLIGETWFPAADLFPFFRHVDEIEAALVAVFGRERMLVPADIRGAHPDLATAITLDGWPTLATTRGRIIAVLNERGPAREEYQQFGGLDPDDRLLFQIGDLAHPHPDEVIFSFEPASAANLPQIERLVRRGRLVHATIDDRALLPRLRAAGTHLIVSRSPDDPPADDPRAADDSPLVCNPITAPDGAPLGRVKLPERFGQPPPDAIEARRRRIRAALAKAPPPSPPVVPRGKARKRRRT